MLFRSKYKRGGLERSVLGTPCAQTLSDGWVGAASMRQMFDPETQALRPILEREVSRALEELPEEFRITVMLSDVEDFSYKEIAEMMGCPIGTVMSRLHRGRHLLQTALRDHAVSMGIIPNDPAQEEHLVDLAEFRARRQGVS